MKIRQRQLATTVYQNKGVAKGVLVSRTGGGGNSSILDLVLIGAQPPVVRC